MTCSILGSMLLPSVAQAEAPPSYILFWGDLDNPDLPGNFLLELGLTTDDQGFVYVADHDNARVQKFTRDGRFVTLWGTRGPGNGQFEDGPMGIAADHLGNIYVTEDLGRIQKFSASGDFIASWGVAGT